MTNNQLQNCRKTLDKTQKQLAELVGASLKAIQSYEQGWRRIPGHIERQVLFLVYRKKEAGKRRAHCWEQKNCPSERKNKCPAWEFRAGHMCWFVSGTICEGKVLKDWEEKMKICRNCNVLTSMINTG